MHKQLSIVGLKGIAHRSHNGEGSIGKIVKPVLAPVENHGEHYFEADNLCLGKDIGFEQRHHTTRKCYDLERKTGTGKKYKEMFHNEIKFISFITLSFPNSFRKGKTSDGRYRTSPKTGE